MSETEAMKSIAKGHDSMMAVMMSRSKNLQIVRALWTGGNTKVCVGQDLTLKVLVATIDAQWEGMGDVGSARKIKVAITKLTAHNVWPGV